MCIKYFLNEAIDIICFRLFIARTTSEGLHEKNATYPVKSRKNVSVVWNDRVTELIEVCRSINWHCRGHMLKNAVFGVIME